MRNGLCNSNDSVLANPSGHPMLQLNPPIPLDTPKGPAFAHLAIDYGQEHYMLFVCFVSATGECWIFPNRDVKIQKNLTMGIRMPSAPPPCSCAEDDARLEATRV